MPEPLKLLSVPEVVVMSSGLKSVLSSLRVKVMVAVWPRLTSLLLLVMAIVGGVLSTALVVSKAMLTWLLAS